MITTFILFTATILTNTILDFALQRNEVAMKKMWFNRYMVEHALIMGLGLAFWGLLAFGFSWLFLIWLVVNVGLHPVIDSLEIIIRRGAGPDKKLFWVVLGFGEAIHTLLIAAGFLLYIAQI